MNAVYYGFMVHYGLYAEGTSQRQLSDYCVANLIQDFFVLYSSHIASQLWFSYGRDLLCQEHGIIERLLTVYNIVGVQHHVARQSRFLQMPGKRHDIDRLRMDICCII